MSSLSSTRSTNAKPDNSPISASAALIRSSQAMRRSSVTTGCAKLRAGPAASRGNFS